MSTQVILLERVENLGNMGEIVTVKPGYARNYLLPQKKALRASKDNIAYFEAQKKQLEADNANRRKDAEAQAKKLENLSIAIIRQASESGQLFGSVTARDIAEATSAASGLAIARAHVELNQNFKSIGLFPQIIALHPEVRTEITVNIARSDEEAARQQETGRAVTEEAPVEEETTASAVDFDEENLSVALDADTLAAEKAAAEADAEDAAEAEAKAAEKAAVKAAKAEKAAAKAAKEEADSEEETTEIG